MRVVHISNVSSRYPSGIGNHIRALAAELNVQGVLAETLWMEDVSLGSKEGLASRTRFEIGLVSATSRSAIRRADILHLHRGDGWSLALASKMRKHPAIVTTLHGNDFATPSLYLSALRREHLAPSMRKYEIGRAHV